VDIYTYSKNISDVKKRRAQKEKIYQQGCVELQLQSKLSKYTVKPVDKHIMEKFTVHNFLYLYMMQH